ncbi:MAG: T9SS type A sorting domain-containing protein [Bacteroidetes bacterium]|nr:T9SS type A sorting domain-containing protein [Bacteroidota bacterium]
MKRINKTMISHGALLIYIWLCSLSLHAQFYSKRSVLFGGTSNGIISSIQVVNDTIYAMCALFDTVPPYKSIGTFNIYDKNGDLISKHRVDIPDQGYIGNEHNNLIQTRDNGFLYGGYSYTDSDNSVMLLKFDHLGNQQWYRTYSDSGKYLNLYINAFTQDSSSNYYFVGNVQHPSTYDLDILVAKADSSGNLAYFKVFNDPSLNDAGLGGIINHSNNVVITGDCGRVSGPSGVYHKFYELDTAGNVLRYSLGTDTSGPSIFAITMIGNEKYLMAGGSLCDGGYINGFFKGNISCFDTSFNRIWSLDLGPCGGYQTYFWALKLLPDSNYLAVGKWYDPADTNHYDQYGWLVKFTPNGTVLWEHRYRGIYNPSPYGDESQLLSVGLFSDNTIITADEATDRSAPRNSQQGWLLHLDVDGCLPDSNTCGIVAGVSDVAHSPDWVIRLYPDPASERFTLDYQLSDASSSAYITVTDMLGREVYKEIITETRGTILFETSAWQDGLYYCTIVSAAGLHLSRPVSVMH